MIFIRAVLCSKNLHFFLDFFSEGINKMNCVFENIYTPPQLNQIFQSQIRFFQSTQSNIQNSQTRGNIYSLVFNPSGFWKSPKNGKDLWVTMEHCPFTRFLWFDPSFKEDENESERKQLKEYLENLPENEQKDEKIFSFVLLKNKSGVAKCKSRHFRRGNQRYSQQKNDRKLNIPTQNKEKQIRLRSFSATQKVQFH